MQVNTALRQLERPARLEDLDAVTTIMIEGMGSTPGYNWRFPHRLQYPDDHWNYYRWMFGGFFQDSDKFLLKVIELVRRNDDNSSSEAVSEIVSFALWSLPLSAEAAAKAVKEPAPLRPPYDGPRRDADLVRSQTFTKTIDTIVEKYFAGRSQLGLILLATLPAHHGEGAGSRLVRWGLQYGADRNLPVTVISADTNRERYEHWGFEVVGSVEESGTGRDKIVYALVCEPRKPIVA